MTRADSAHLPVLQRWLSQLKPLRILVLGQRLAEDDSWRGCREYLETQLSSESEWSRHLPEPLRPTLVYRDLESWDEHGNDSVFDLVICLDELLDLPAGIGGRIVAGLRRQARFLAVVLRNVEDAASETSWPTLAWRGLEPLAFHQAGAEIACLLRGGRTLAEAPDAPEGRVWYIAPHHALHGGVKILYDHVAILNEQGIPAVLGTSDATNWPATWFLWEPKNMVFSAHAPARVTSADTVVISEYRYRDVEIYRQARRKLLFSQNPGLTIGFSRWRALGYDGVLTLRRPDGETSQLQQFLQRRSTLPIFPIANHLPADLFGQPRPPRVPGRVLCLPRKGKEYIERLEREFTGLYRVDNQPQARMAVEYASADVYVHTGFPEGQPLPPLEAMVSGCIVCGFTGVGGLDVMHDGITAYVARDGDHRELARALQRALHDPQREQVRAAGTAVAQQFSRAVTAGDLRQGYRDWLPGISRGKVLSRSGIRA